jgi:nucleotide-binding universal stress UspA family protein
MGRFLVAVDGSENALRAVEYTIERWRDGWFESVRVLSVQMPLPSVVSDFLPAGASERYHRDEGERATTPARQRLEAAQVPHDIGLELGLPAETIVSDAVRHECGHIVMGCRGLSAVPGLLLGSVTTRTIHLATVPVIVIR